MDWQPGDDATTAYEIFHRPRRSRAPMIVGVIAAVVAVVVLGAVLVGRLLFRESTGDPGRTAEQLYVWQPVSGPVPALTNATAEWGLDAWQHLGTDQASGGVAIMDLDGDERPDVVAGGGGLAVFFATESGRFELASGVLEALTAQVTSVGLSDVDLDGTPEILVGTSGQNDLVVWGGPWVSRRDFTGVEVTELPAGKPTTGLLAGDLSGDGLPDVLRLGYGPAGEAPSPDVVWVRRPDRREFDPVELPSSKRRSLAAELADVDEDGLVDIWVTRDIGWEDGPNSVYSRRGIADGDWHDDASRLGAEQAIDGMGVALTDFTGDGLLDAYLTDIGDNELLIRRIDRFEPFLASGAARIRPVDAPPGDVSSSWAAGTTDVNLDGILDLIVANGAFPGIANKVPDTEVLVSDPPAVFLGIGEARFADVWPDLGIDWTGSSRGMALGDVDRDGDTDVLIVNHSQGLVALRNDGDAPTLTVRPEDVDCDVAGVIVSVELAGGRITTLAAPHSFLGAHAAEVVLGTGSNLRALVAVTAPGQEPLEFEVDLDDPRTELGFPCP